MIETFSEEVNQFTQLLIDFGCDVSKMPHNQNDSIFRSMKNILSCIKLQHTSPGRKVSKLQVSKNSNLFLFPTNLISFNAH